MTGAQNFIRNGLAQTDLDMAGFRLLNLDTSNLPPSGIPPTIVCAAHNWLNGWNASSQTWSQRQPAFTDIAGPLTSFQQQGITQLGVITSGTWHGAQINAFYLPSLDAITPPAADVSANNFKITNLADPVNPGDAVNKNFMDLLLQGLNPKQAVRVATTASVSKSGLPLVDGVQLVTGDRVLVKDQGLVRLVDNGIYVAGLGTWQRATDADHGSGDVGFNSQNSIDAGCYCVVLNGTVNGGTSWFQKDAVVHVTSDAKEFVLFSNAQNILAGNGLTFAGNILNVVGTTNRISVGTTVDIDSHYVGQTSITTLGTITSGTWNGTILNQAYGGTGVANTYTISTIGPFTTAFSGSPPVGAGLTLRVTDTTDIILPITGTVATIDQPETFTFKRITRRATITATSSAPAINTDTTDVYEISALSTNITSFTTNLTGSPQVSDQLEIWIRDNGTSRTLAFGTAFSNSPDLLLPTATTAGKWMRLLFAYNATSFKWVLVEFLNNIP